MQFNYVLLVLGFLFGFVALFEATNYEVNSSDITQSCNYNKWRSFKRRYGKSYDEDLSETDQFRMSIFCKNLMKILQHNEQFPNKTYKMGINHFSDLTPEERARWTSGLKTKSSQEDLLKDQDRISLDDVADWLDLSVEPPPEVDWSLDPGRVSSARDQGDCGSCWAFALIGLLEGQEVPMGAKLINGSLVPLSEQQLVDCDKFNGGCMGGNFLSALKEIRRFGGVMERKDYPYVSGQTQKRGQCKLDKTRLFPTTKHLGEPKLLNDGDEELLKRIVASYGPVAIGIESSSSFNDYESGVYHEPDCKNELNHAILLVGYGQDNTTGLDYWKIKNSWTEDWGQNGFGLMSRNRNNNCGVASMAVIIGAKNLS